VPVDSSTLVRHVSMTAMLVGPSGEVADKVSRRFEEANVSVVRASHAAAACERVAVAMPQVVVVLGTLRADEREALADRATAVGALLMYVDPELDDETLAELVARAAQAAVERKRLRDEPGPAPKHDDPPEDIDGKW
jgi:hypothetical protein